MNFLLSQTQLPSLGSEVSAFGGMTEITTYGQCVCAIRNFWEYTAHSDCRNPDAADICEKLMAYLSFPLWSAPLDDRKREALPFEDA